MAAENIPTFDSDATDGTGLGPKRERWLLRFENYLLAAAITDDARQRAILLYSMSLGTFDKYDYYHTHLQASATMCSFADKDTEIKSHIIVTTAD